MKLADLEQRVIVPIIDQTKGGIQYEVEISIEELLKGSLEDFEPILVDAIPVEWLLKKKASCMRMSGCVSPNARLIGELIKGWQKEQEAEV